MFYPRNFKDKAFFIPVISLFQDGNKVRIRKYLPPPDTELLPFVTENKDTLVSLSSGNTKKDCGTGDIWVEVLFITSC